MRKTTFTMIFVASVCVTILASIAVVAPKAVRAAVATLIRDQDNTARHPWAAECLITSASPQGSCAYSLYAGNEYVVQNVTLQVPPGSSFSAVTFSAFCTSAGVLNTFLAATIPAAGTASNATAYQTFPVTAYCDPQGASSSGGVQAAVGLSGASPSLGNPAQVWLSGYYVTLP